MLVKKAHEFFLVESGKGKHCGGRLKLVAFFVSCSCHESKVAVARAVNEYTCVYVNTCAFADYRYSGKSAVLYDCVAKLGVKQQAHSRVKAGPECQQLEFIGVDYCN